MTLAADREAGTDALEVRFLRLREGARLPARQSDLASGYDLHAALDAPVSVGTMPVRIPCGFAMAVPPGTDAQIRPRSGLSAKGVMATLGTLDADYRGEVMVTLYCLPDAAPFEVRDGDRIAQLVISRLVPVEWREVETLDETGRGAGGHGSTGVR